MCQNYVNLFFGFFFFVLFLLTVIDLGGYKYKAIVFCHPILKELTLGKLPVSVLISCQCGHGEWQ